mmetsp:Transcript_27717/g.73156  ORF Transcript_27717/g.73156 Transcript_27717/m.73156 type:complete len:90 (-) Transcript_27717:64-333(-)
MSVEASATKFGGVALSTRNSKTSLPDTRGRTISRCKRHRSSKCTPERGDTKRKITETRLAQWSSTCASICKLHATRKPHLRLLEDAQKP